jgi:predicted RNase H-like HicB family nuclease
MTFGYGYASERQDNGWWLVRFPGIPEAPTEGETKEEARANARDCVITALASSSPKTRYPPEPPKACRNRPL